MDNIKFIDGQVKVIFTDGNKSFFINSEEGKTNLKNLKFELGVNHLGYLKQIHSNKVIKYNFENEIEADGLIAQGEKIALGVFTADCIPIILYDKTNNTISAVHSGWRGTNENIITEAINNMIIDYNCSKENIKVIIGPHIRECCYEVGEEVENAFSKEYSNLNLNRKHFSMEQIILEQCDRIGIKKENITTVKECTYCSDKKYYSYRRDNGKCGRMFSYIYI